MAAGNFPYRDLELHRQSRGECEDYPAEGGYGSWHDQRQYVHRQRRNGFVYLADLCDVEQPVPITRSRSPALPIPWSMIPATVTSPSLRWEQLPRLPSLPRMAGNRGSGGLRMTVTWSYTGSPGSNVQITLLKAGTSIGTINASTSVGSGGTGSYTWPISATGADRL